MQQAAFFSRKAREKKRKTISTLHVCSYSQVLKPLVTASSYNVLFKIQDSFDYRFAAQGQAMKGSLKSGKATSKNRKICEYINN